MSANYSSVHSGVEMNINACNHSTIDGMHTEISEVHSGFSISFRLNTQYCFLASRKAYCRIRQMRNSCVTIVYVYCELHLEVGLVYCNLLNHGVTICIISLTFEISEFYPYILRHLRIFYESQSKQKYCCLPHRPLGSWNGESLCFL